MPGVPEDQRRSSPFLAAFGYLLAVFFAGLMLTFDASIAMCAFHKIRAVGFPTVTGVMLLSEVGIDDSSTDSTSYWPVVQYRYSVAGRNYVGTRHRYGLVMSTDKEWATRILASHPVGSPVEVHYSPSDPNDAVLLVGLEGSDLLAALALVPLTILALACCIPLGLAIRRRVRPAAAVCVGKPDDGAPSGKLLTAWRPPYTGVAVVAALSLVGALVVGSVFKAPPPLRVMLVTWGVILGIGALAYVLHARAAGKSMRSAAEDRPEP
jgi:hypothetical protein